MLILTDLDNYSVKLESLSPEAKANPLASGYVASLCAANALLQDHDDDPDGYDTITVWLKPEGLVRMINEIEKILGADTVREIQYRLLAEG